MSLKPTVCLVTPGHLSSTPRLIKEALSLSSAGYHIHIVAGSYMSELTSHDTKLENDHSWQTTYVCFKGTWERKLLGLLEKLLRFLVAIKIPLPIGLYALADSRWSYLLHRTLKNLPADLYIAHCFSALYPAVQTAKTNQTKAGFDAEDYHCGEFLPNSFSNRTRIKIRRKLEKFLIPQLSHRTAAAPLITEQYKHDYGHSFLTINNVFPRKHAPKEPTKSIKPTSPIRFFWFSQTVGPGRGLEQFIQLMGLASLNSELHLLGFTNKNFIHHLNQLAKRHNVDQTVFFHQPVHGDQLIKLASEYDVGLSLELTSPPHRALCLTNKIFSYILAGLPMVLSKTPSQILFARQHPNLCQLIDLGDLSQSATQIQNFLTDTDKLEQLKLHSWKLGQELVNWEVEQKKFIASVENVLTEESQ